MSDTPNSAANIRHYRRLVRKIIARHFGKEASRIVYKRSGLSNYVFAVNHLEGQFVIRISPDAENLDSFKKELWATQKVREAGVPTPEVLAVGYEVISAPYMISRRVTGVEATHHPRRRDIVHEMGRHAAIIASIRTNNFGTVFDWADSSVTPVSWPEFLEDEWGKEQRLELFRKHGILPEGSIKKLRSIIDEAKTIEAKPSLSHGDLRMKNVIVDEDGQITALIDWQDCLSTGSAAWELSIALHDLAIDEKNAFIEGYGCRHSQMAEMTSLMRAFNIMNYCQAIEAAVEKSELKLLNQIKLRISGALDLYCL